MSDQGQENQLPLIPSFGEGFLLDHAGRLMRDSAKAIVEIIANSWDAGADRVEITWPTDGIVGEIQIADNGTGMSQVEFEERWMVLSYNRVRDQGDDVGFPTGNKRSNRKAFGRNGKGRHAVFCFADNYFLETTKQNESVEYEVSISHGEKPFEVRQIGTSANTADQHGTRIYTKMVRNGLYERELIEIVGSKFIADPSFRVFVNENEVELVDLQNLYEEETLKITGLGEVKILIFDSAKTGRTSLQHGVAWWVNGRLVGDVSWKSIEGEAYLDARTLEGKRLTFIVIADFLINDIEADWSGFKNTENVNSVMPIVETFIARKLGRLLQDSHRARKVSAVEEHKEDLRSLSPISRKHIGKFIDELQEKAPMIQQKDLSNVVQVMATLEKSRSGYELLEKLAKLDPEDMDALDRILDEWDIFEIEIVLSELYTRLEVIKRLEGIVEDPETDELHEIHPLIEKGLWIFGPEFESSQFTSNRALITVLRELFGAEDANIEAPYRRPDIVALPDGSISVFSRDSYNDDGEVQGVAKVLIVELKKGGSKISRKEMTQATDYASSIRASGRIELGTQIQAYVCGADLANDSRDKRTEGEPVHTIVVPTTYSVVLRKAHARTFDLIKKLEEGREEKLVDRDIEGVLNQPELI